MSDSHTIIAEIRDVQGTGASRRLRHAGKIPAVLYGSGKDPVMVTLNHNRLYHNLEDESFHSSILTVEVEGKKEKAILRDVQMHAYKQLIMHVDLQRVSATEKIHMSIPLHYTGGDEAPGVKIENGIITLVVMKRPGSKLKMALSLISSLSLISFVCQTISQNSSLLMYPN